MKRLLVLLLCGAGCIDFDALGEQACRDRPAVCEPDAGAVASCTNIVGDRRTQVCLRWTCDRADLSEGTWAGNVAACMPGDIAVGRANALKLVNTYRFIADLPPVTTVANRDSAAQACALMMNAANMLTATPDAGSPCYSTGGADAAANSLMLVSPAVRAIDLSMAAGTPNMSGRRVLLSNQLGAMGIGGTTSYSCLWVLGGSGTANARFAAWPPPGPVPLEAIEIPTVGAASSVDKLGWSIHTYATSTDFTGAAVTVTDNGVSRPVAATVLGGTGGSLSAIRFVPQGWVSQAGHSYVVSVTAAGLATPISYTVDVISCP